MKNQIEIWDTNKSKKGYEVEYSIDLGADITLDISKEILLNYIVENELNVLEYFNHTKTDIEHVTVDAKTYLDEHSFMIIKEYLNDLHK
jgi:hypothetical protein